MTYDLTTIMENAWVYARQYGVSKGGRPIEYIAFALKKAWAEAKEKAAKAATPWGREWESMKKNLRGKGTRTKFTKVPLVAKALKALNVTKKAFIDNQVDYYDVAKMMYEVENGKVEVVDNRSEGQKAVDWYARKKGMNRQERIQFLPKAKEVEEYAENNNCTVFQAVARMSVFQEENNMNTQIRNIKRLLADENIPANQIAIESGLTRAAIGKLRNGEQALEDVKLSTFLALNETTEKMIKNRKLNHFETQTFAYAEKDYVKARKNVYSTVERMHPTTVNVTIVHNGNGNFDIVVEISDLGRSDMKGFKNVKIPKIIGLASADFEDIAAKSNIESELIFDVFKTSWTYCQNADIKAVKDNVEQHKKLLKVYKQNDFK